MCLSIGLSVKFFSQWRREGVCRPEQTSVLTPPPIRSATDILMVTTMALLWTVTNSSLGEQLVLYVMQIPAESVLQCKCQFARRGQISEFYIFAPPNAAPCTVPPEAHASLPPSSSRHCFQLLRSTQPGRPSVDWIDATNTSKTV